MSGSYSRARRGLLGAAASVLVLAPLGSAQNEMAPDSAEAFRLIQERRRDLAHPGDPLKIVGVFDESNDLRAGHGSLVRSSYEPLLVDQTEARDRQLALFAGEGWRSTPVPQENPGQKGGAAPRARALAPPGDEQEGSSRGAWIAALVVAAAATAALVAQRR